MPENRDKSGRLQYDLSEVEKVLEGQTRNLFLAKLAGKSIDLFAVENDLPITAVARMNKEGLAKLRRAKNGSSAVKSTVTLQSREPTRQSHEAPTDSDWRVQAACRYEDPELFFPVGISKNAVSQAMDAKEVCNRCHVTADCLQWALTNGEDFGVWGGKTEDERRAYKRRRR